MKFIFVRSAPLNVTPAVERYASFLKNEGFGGEVQGFELDFQPNRPAVRFVDHVVGQKTLFETTRERILALMKWQFYLTRRLLRERPQIVQFCDVFSAIPAMLAKWFKGAKLVFDIRDPVKPSVSHWGPIISKALSSVEELAALTSDAVIVVSKPRLRFLPNCIQAEAFVVPNVPRQDSFDGLQFSNNGQMLVNLAGFISYRRNLSAWCELQRQDNYVTLDVYGAVPDAQTRAILNHYAISNVPRIGHAHALERMKRADVVSLMYDPLIEINRFASPNKYFEALMLGKPVLCARGMMLEREIEEADCGLVVPYDDLDALTSAVERIKDKKERERMGSNARRLYEEVYRGMPERTMMTMYRSIGVIPELKHTAEGG